VWKPRGTDRMRPPSIDTTMGAVFAGLVAAIQGSALRGYDGAVPASNFTTYRVTPITYPSLANMDSGDAAGDVFFGMSQLLLPQLCATDPSFLWCQNRAYLSGGSAWMVYSGFKVVTRDVYGEYEPCNPCQGHGQGSKSEVQTCPPGVPNGTFVCRSYNDMGPTPPPQCSGSFQIWHEDCLNGTVYKTLTGLDPKEAEGKCCEACSADKTTCAGWNMPQGDNGTECQLMKEPLVMWDGGQDVSKCKAAQVDHSQYRCWYSNPEYATAFAPFCNRSECNCDVIDNHLPVGREIDAMCHQYSSDSMSAMQRSRTVTPELRGLAPTPTAPNYWSCSDALQELCFNGYMPGPQCSECATDSSHWSALQRAGCTADMIPHLCDADYETCGEEVRKICGPTIGQRTACSECYKRNTHELEKSNCTDFFASYTCSGGGHEHNKWQEFVYQLACRMHGNWYSTTGSGECKSKELTPDCWWYIEEEIRTVNASCADGKVISAVQAVRPECWKACPDGQGTNTSSVCYLDCLFETILGNSTTGIQPMEAEALTKPFEDAFTQPLNAGGCQAVHAPKPSTPPPVPLTHAAASGTTVALAPVDEVLAE